MNEFISDWENNKFPQQRLGQAFCNHFNILLPELFYCEDRKKIGEMISKVMSDYQLTYP